MQGSEGKISLKRRISLALGEEPADLFVKNCRLVNTLSGEVHDASFAVADGMVVGFGDYEAQDTLDAQGRYVCPGLIDGHIHIESSLLTPYEFARAVAPHGTAAVVCDPHEIANVLGRNGLMYMLEAGRGLPVGIYFMMPSCVPATHLETSGASLDASDVAWFLKEHPDRFLGLAEMMNFPGVLFKDPGVLAKLEAAAGRRMDGHAPGLSGRALSAYVAAGPASDHECTTLEEAREKLRLGMHIMIREGTSEKNLADLVELARHGGGQRLMLVSDDRHPEDLMARGHLDWTVREAIRLGVDPVTAVRMASLNTAVYFGLKERGALAPGYRADFMLLDDLQEFRISEVYLGGKRMDTLEFPTPKISPGINTEGSMNIAGLSEESFHIMAGEGRLRAIEVVPGQIVTREYLAEPKTEKGLALANAEENLAKLAVIERHSASGRTGLGFVRGLGIERGALASTVAHDSHNLIVAGMSDSDMLLAARHAVKIGGGLVVAEGGRVLADLPLPVAGLMSALGLEDTVYRLRDLNAAASALGEKVMENPFMTLSFLALPVIPRLKLTDLGLMDVEKFDFVSLFSD